MEGPNPCVFSVDVVPAVVSIDHSSAIALAIENVWPSSTIITCWPHMIRNCSKQSSLLQDKSLYKNAIKDHIYNLHYARSHDQFLAMAAVNIAHWQKIGEGKFAAWFQNAYVHRRWSSWHVNASSIYGVLPNQQAIESHHAAIKVIAAENLKAPTATVLNVVIPRFLIHDGTRWLTVQSVITVKMLTKANELKTNASNHAMVLSGSGRHRQLIGFVFNSRSAMVSEGRLTGSVVDTARVRRFRQSLLGKLPVKADANSLRFDVLSLHMVCVDVAALEGKEPLLAAPVWPRRNVEFTRDTFSCTWKAFGQSGRLCSHVLAAMGLLNVFDIKLAGSSVPRVRQVGRPTKSRGALIIDPDDDGHRRDPYSVDSLMASFIANHGRPLWQPVVESYDLETDDGPTTEHLAGQVISVRQQNGVLVWRVRFGNEEEEDMEVERLAVAFRLARKMGARY